MGVLTFVRHGQASFGSDNYDRLSELGCEQVRVLGAYWASQGRTFDAVYSGPLERQKDSARIIGEELRAVGLPWPEPVVLDGLAEFPVEPLVKRYMPELMMEDPDFADLILRFQNAEDKEAKDALFQEAFEIVTGHWITGRFADAPESWEAFLDRVERAVDRMTDAAHEGGRVLAVSSGGPTGIVTRYAMEGAPKKALDLAWVVCNAAYSEFAFGKGGLTLRTFNAIPHFDGRRELVTHR